MLKLVESEALTNSSALLRFVVAYHLIEELTALVIYFMLVFAPWAFGTTEPWSIWAMNVCGYALGALLLLKVAIRRVRPLLISTASGHSLAGRLLPRTLAVLTTLILLYCLASAVNARASFNPDSGTFQYHRYARWLPYSLDGASSWGAFWNYLALACSFWAIQDWLAGHSIIAGRRGRRSRDARPGLNARLVQLLSVLALSGGLLALEGIVQRVAGSPRLLFLVRPEIHQSAQTQFASFAYRANAGQYFNLLWPVCLGFWWMIHQNHGYGALTKYLLLFSTVLMAASPIISSARGAALVDLAMLCTCALVLLISTVLWPPANSRQSKYRSAGLIMLFLAGSLALGLSIGWTELSPRLKHFQTDIAAREQLNARARLIAHDYPVFGTGPGTFERVFGVYRGSADSYWPAQLHNDWLETRVTSGLVGSGLIILAFLTVLLASLGVGVPKGQGTSPLTPFSSSSSSSSSSLGSARNRKKSDSGKLFVCFAWLSLAGCLVQARWDFPLQVYSILFLFLLWCAVLFSFLRAGAGTARPRVDGQEEKSRGRAVPSPGRL